MKFITVLVMYKLNKYFNRCIAFIERYIVCWNKIYRDKQYEEYEILMIGAYENT
jgi:hypothetical protein